MAYEWPGNVRELKGVLEYAFVIAESGGITPRHLPPKMIMGRGAPQAPPPRRSLRPNPAGLGQRDALVEALRRTGGNHTKAAELLGVNRVTVYNRMKKYGIELKLVMNSGQMG